MPLQIVKREDLDLCLHISHSQLRTYLTCSQRYLYQYVRGLPWEFIPDYFPFGRSVHTAAKAFYLSMKETGKRISLEELTGHFTKSWDHESQGNIRYQKGQDKDSLKAKGILMLEAFHENVAPRKILEVEYPFSVALVQKKTGEILPYNLSGIFDLIEADEEGTIIVVELKTGSKRFTEEQLDLDLQGTLYSYALKQIGFSTNGGDTLVRYDLLLKLKEPKMDSYFAVKGNVDFEWAYQLIKKVLRAIEVGTFYPTPGWWRKDCPFGTTCKKEQ